jgi:F-type H+-transporting ATPase subunit epsilon
MAEEDQERLILELIGPERVYYEVKEADQIIAESLGGEFAIMPGHTSLMAALRTGKCIAVRGDGKRKFALHGGMLEVRKDRVRVLTPAAEEGKDIDRERAERALERAKKRIESKEKDLDMARARAALERAMNRLRVADLS